MPDIKIPLILRLTSLYVVSALVLVAFGAAGSQATSLNSNFPAPKSKLVLQKETISGKPTQLIIPRLNIKLDIHDGKYDSVNNSWDLTDSAAHFATITSVPNNESGNTFLYGHNTEAVLGNTKDLVPGDQLIVKTANNHRFTYTYSSSKNTTANDTTPLKDDGKEPFLTLLTCSGVWSEQRRVMIFTFKDVQ